MDVFSLKMCLNEVFSTTLKLCAFGKNHLI
jgi:hypothetical protein